MRATLGGGIGSSENTEVLEERTKSLSQFSFFPVRSFW